MLYISRLGFDLIIRLAILCQAMGAKYDNDI